MASIHLNELTCTPDVGMKLHHFFGKRNNRSKTLCNSLPFVYMVIIRQLLTFINSSLTVRRFSNYLICPWTNECRFTRLNSSFQCFCLSPKIHEYYIENNILDRHTHWIRCVVMCDVAQCSIQCDSSFHLSVHRTFFISTVWHDCAVCTAPPHK